MYHANKFISYTLIFNMLNFEDEFILFYHLYPKPFVQLSVERKKNIMHVHQQPLLSACVAPFASPLFPLLPPTCSYLRGRIVPHNALRKLRRYALSSVKSISYCCYLSHPHHAALDMCFSLATALSHNFRLQMKSYVLQLRHLRTF